MSSIETDGDVKRARVAALMAGQSVDRMHTRSSVEERAG